MPGETASVAVDAYGSYTAPNDSFPSAPSVSVVVPCLNEVRYIGQVLENLARQRQSGEFEIIIVDGMSTDGTRAAVREFADANQNVCVRLVDNPARDIPTALNLGIESARHEVIARMDAHAVPSVNYLRDCLNQLGHNGVSVVGAPCRIRPGAATAIAQANAAAVSHPFGIGDAKYRTLTETSPSRFVDTVPFGVFTKQLWRDLGGYNERLLANEDYDFNYRVRQNGGSLLLETSSYCTYYARSTFSMLARQYARYGYWKAQMARLHPRSIRPRQLIAPLFVIALLLLGPASFWFPPAWWLLGVGLGSYLILAIVFAAKISCREREPKIVVLAPISFLIIHLAWGTGFLVGLCRFPERTNTTAKPLAGRVESMVGS
jgi:succinoglycan biosynthesis protein ExoA